MSITQEQYETLVGLRDTVFSLQLSLAKLYGVRPELARVPHHLFDLFMFDPGTRFEDAEQKAIIVLGVKVVPWQFGYVQVETREEVGRFVTSDGSHVQFTAPEIPKQLLEPIL